jgi:hypothetical protein
MTGAYTPPVVLGINIANEGIQYGLVRPERGEGIILEDDGFPYCQVDRQANQIWILFQMGRSGSPTEQTLFRKILTEVAAVWSLTPEQYIEREKQIRLARRPQSRIEYMKVCSGRIKKQVESLEKQLVNTQRRIDELQASLIASIRDGKRIEGSIPSLRDMANKDDEKYGSEFDKLLSLPLVEEVEVSPTKVKVYTDTLYCVDSRTRKKHEIGKFRIELPIAEAGAVVRWFNLTRQVNGVRTNMNAPHIYSDGNACLGNTSEVFPSLLAAYEFSAAAQIAIAFAQSANVEDLAGAYINRWPIVEDGTVIPSTHESAPIEPVAEEEEEDEEDLDDNERDYEEE